MSQPTYRHAFVLVAGSCLIFIVTGCGTSGIDRQLVFGELDSQHLVERMKSGETSRADEQAFILKNHDAWREARSDRGLVNPTEEGPLAAKFHELQARAPNCAFRNLSWVWLHLAVTDPGLDLRKGSVERPAAADAP